MGVSDDYFFKQTFLRDNVRHRNPKEVLYTSPLEFPNDSVLILLPFSVFLLNRGDEC